jgi:hypothetical protein
MSLLEKLKKNSTIKDSAILSKSKFFNDKDMIPTAVPMINVALSGRLDGGITPGLTMWAGPSKHFKTALSLLMAKSYIDNYTEGNRRSSRARGSEFSMKSKLKSSTSRTQTPSRSPDNIPHTKGKNKKGKSKERRRMALNDEHRELLQANLKRISNVPWCDDC